MASLTQASSLCGCMNRLSLASSSRSLQGFGTSNGTIHRLAAKSRNTFHVEVSVAEDESSDFAVKRFRRAVMSTGLVNEVRRRRYFENPQDAKKRKFKEKCMQRKGRQFRTPTFDEGVAGSEPAPFADLFGDPEDIFADGPLLTRN